MSSYIILYWLSVRLTTTAEKSDDDLIVIINRTDAMGKSKEGEELGVANSYRIQPLASVHVHVESAIAMLWVHLDLSLFYCHGRMGFNDHTGCWWARTVSRLLLY